MTNGLIHLYYGEGKGKTTAAVGLALRALGNSERVVVVQFLKGSDTGEIPLLRELGATVLRCDAGQKFVFQMDEQEKAETRALHNRNLQAALERPSDLLVLDEACAACALGVVDEQLLQQAVLQKPAQREVVLTGRDPVDWMRQAADYCTEMRCHKHPYEQGIPARKGVEF